MIFYELIIYYDVGCKVYKYHDMESLIYDLNHDLYNLARMCTGLTISKWVNNKQVV